MSGFAPIRCVTWEATRPVAPGALTPNAAGRIQVLATLDGWPSALLDVCDADSEAAVLEIVRSRTAEVCAVDPRTAPRPAAAPAVSVVVCTLGHEPRLRETVAAILAGDHPLELIVVDNKPGSGTVRALLADCHDPRLRIVAEARRGLSRARNTGLAAACHPVIAFTDDDALPAPDWVARLAEVFARSEQVTCVTGLVLPAALTTADQAFFEEAGGFGKGLQAHQWTDTPGPADDLGLSPGPRGVAFPFDGGFGSGNNMAFRTERLRRLGGFDIALGAGSPARGGEDLDVSQRAYLHGHTIVYWPGALVRHHHRADRAGLVAQMHGYGVGMAAVVTKRMLTSPRHALGVLRRLPGGLRLLLAADSAKNRHKSAAFPPAVTRAERRGYLSGPFRYLASVVGSRLRAR